MNKPEEENLKLTDEFIEKWNNLEPERQNAVMDKYNEIIRLVIEEKINGKPNKNL
jgi:hypothetical protein